MKRYLNVFFVFICVVLLSACSSISTYKKLSAAHTGCSPDQIDIEDFNDPILLPGVSWVAKCNGKTFYCFASTSSESCKEEN